MNGMRKTPEHLHREVLKRPPAPFDTPGVKVQPAWYALWLGEPHVKGSVRIGRTERLPRYPYWRAYPETGEWPRIIRTWVGAIEWLTDVWKGHQATHEGVRASEGERVEEAG